MVMVVPYFRSMNNSQLDKKKNTASLGGYGRRLLQIQGQPVLHNEGSVSKANKEKSKNNILICVLLRTDFQIIKKIIY